MVDKALDRAHEAYEHTQKLGSDAIDQAGSAAASSLNRGTGLPADSTTISDAADTAKETGQDAAHDVDDAGDSIFDKLKDKVSDLFDGGDEKNEPRNRNK